MSGVVHALRCMQRTYVADGHRADARQIGVAIDLVERLLDALPPGHELALCLMQEYHRVRQSEGMTNRAQMLRRAYTQVESAVEGCQSFTVSTNIDAVNDAFLIMQTVAERVSHEPLVVVRGDTLSPNNHGATISATYANGRMLEVTLRRAHPEMDTDDCAPGTWILEGGAAVRACEVSESRTSEIYPVLDSVLGDELPDNIASIVENQVRTFMRACASNVAVVNFG